MKLGRHQKFNGVDYEFRLCERHFASRGSIYAHCRYTSQHEWCERCRRVFVSERAKNDHLRYSHRHNICWNCPDRRDFETPKDLKNHLSECHHYCHPCHRAHNSARELQDHDVAIHHLCVKCGQYFQNENSLRMVSCLLSPKTMLNCTDNSLLPAPANPPAPRHGMLRLLSDLQIILRHVNPSRVRQLPVRYR